MLVAVINWTAAVKSCEIPTMPITETNLMFKTTPVFLSMVFTQNWLLCLGPHFESRKSTPRNWHDTDPRADVDSASSRKDQSLLERLPLDFDVEVISSSQFLSATSIDHHISRVCVLTSQWVCKASMASPFVVFVTRARALIQVLTSVILCRTSR